MFMNFGLHQILIHWVVKSFLLKWQQLSVDVGLQRSRLTKNFIFSFNVVDLPIDVSQSAEKFTERTTSREMCWPDARARFKGKGTETMSNFGKF